MAKANPILNEETFKQLNRMILKGRMKPWQEVGILFDHKDCIRLGLKSPWGSAAYHLRKNIRDAELHKDYAVASYKTDMESIYYVKVTRVGNTL
jgi:hypothetical protein